MQRLLPIALTLLFALTSAQPGQALTKGAFSTDPRYAAIVRIITGFERSDFGDACTGTFVSPTMILTAAHCLIHEGLKPIAMKYAAFPSDKFDESATEVRAPDVVFHIHPDYPKKPKAGRLNDVALIEFKVPTGHATLPLIKTSLENGTPLSITGYGCDQSTGDHATNFKLSPASTDISGAFIRTWGPQAFLCHGDSSGPALIDTPDELVIVGVNSYARDHADLKPHGKDGITLLDVSNRNSRARQWIDETMAKNSFE